MWDILTSIPYYVVAFLIVLTPVVFIHELGHFWVARRAGVKVEVFSIGFGKELFGFNDRTGTRWKFSALPLGGYVKMFGEYSLGEQDGRPIALSVEQQAVSFHHKSLGWRAAIVAAGPAANYVFAILVFAGLFATYGQQYSSNVIGQVIEGSAAAEAGLAPGDKIVELDGQTITRFEQVVQAIELGLDERSEIVVERDGQVLSFEIAPKIVSVTDIFGNEHRVGRLGIASTGAGEIVRHGPIEALWAATQETWRMTSSMLKAIGQMIVGTRSSEELGGVARIAKMSGDVATQGVAALIGFMALISINLGLINLFPVPMLDGGHLAFYAAEAVRGRRLSPRAEEWGLRIGLAMVLTLFVFATWNDLVSLRVVEYVRSLIG